MTFQVLIVFHAFTAALSVVWMLHAANLVVILNIAVRVVLVALLAVAIMSHSSAGPEDITEARKKLDLSAPGS
jgi:hypothetical protein